MISAICLMLSEKGNSTRACEEGYFEFSHNYSCGPAETVFQHPVSAVPNPDMRNRLISMGLTETDTVCIFKPKVQVLDNWGWCNGSCNGDGNTGCYADEFDDECRLGSSLPWTEYPGEIIVIPND